MHYLNKIMKHDPNIAFEVYGQSCYSAMKYLACSVFDSIAPDLFYAYLYLYTHYDLINAPACSDVFLAEPFDTQMLERYVLEEKLGIEIVDIPVHERLGTAVQQVLEQRLPALLPANKKYLFQEGEIDEYPHPLLVVGYDQRARTFTVYDDVRNYPTIQKEGNEMYISVTISEEKLEQAFRAPMKSFQFARDTIQIIRPSGHLRIPNIHEVLNDIVQQIALQEENGVQIIAKKIKSFLLPKIFEGQLESIGFTRNQLRYINSQKILGYMLSKFLTDQHIDASLNEQVLQANLATWHAWKTLMTVVEMMKLRGQREERVVETLVAKVTSAEEHFLKTIVRLSLYLSASYRQNRISE